MVYFNNEKDVVFELQGAISFDKITLMLGGFDIDFCIEEKKEELEVFIYEDMKIGTFKTKFGVKFGELENKTFKEITVKKDCARQLELIRSFLYRIGTKYLEKEVE